MKSENKEKMWKRFSMKRKRKELIEKMKRIGKEIWKNRVIYLILLPGLIWLFVFAYMPMGGLSLAFKTFHAKLGIWKSPWAGLLNFQYLFRDPAFFNAVWRTLAINIGKLIVTFPVPVILALLFNEMRMRRYSKALQTIFTFPNFLSWIITSGIMINVLSNSGLVNGVLSALGFDTVNFLGPEKMFIPILYLSEIWKTAGWSAIIYIAAITGIDQEQYEAAQIDGAGRMQMMRHITLPSILPTIVVMFILAAGNLMTAGFDQIFNLSNAATKDVAEVLDIYIYRVTFQSSTDFSFSTAVSLFRSVINMILLLLADWGSKCFGGSGLFGEGVKKSEKHRNKK